MLRKFSGAQAAVTMLALFAMLTITGCGGGGGGGLSVAPSFPVAPPVATAPPNDAVPTVEAQENAPPASALNLNSATLVYGGTTREYLYYVPSDFSTQFLADPKGWRLVMSLHDDGQTAEQNADLTRWQDIAEKHGSTIAIFPKSIGGKWNTSGDAAQPDDAGFIVAAYNALRSKLGVSDNCPLFMTGVGTGGTMAQNIAMKTPIYAVGVASIDGIADSSIRNASTLPKGAVSAWMIRSAKNARTPDFDAQVSYWKTANDVAAEPVSENLGYLETTLYTANTNHLQQVRDSVFHGTLPISGAALSEELWKKVFSHTLRFLDDDSVTGTLRAFETIKDMGLRDSSKVFAGSSVVRRWLTYVPPNYADLVASGAKLPLVVSLHGRNGSARWQALLTKWHEVARNSGFIVIYPQGPNSTWDTNAAFDNPDVAFLSSVIADTRANYMIDPERIFFNGVSMGSAMGNRFVGQDPTTFAAAALCYSGHLSAARYAGSELRKDVPLPIWQCRGGTELPSEFPGGTAGETAARLFWRETVNKNVGPPVVQVDGKKTTEIWSDGLAEYRWQVTADVPHFWAVGQAEKIWKEMFSKYRRLADGSLIKSP